jgi:uncharacterized repeat protein (TIGR03803 family)
MSPAPVLKIIVNFTGIDGDGADPIAGLIADGNGNLFGTTSLGGDTGNGAVFEIVNGGTVAAPVYDTGATTIYSFSGVSDGGAIPYAGLIADANGDLFGTTGSGGFGGYGTVFELINQGTAAAPDYTTGATTLYNFSGGSDGANPYAGLIADANGNLFGTTSNGGIGADPGYGTVFEIVNNGSAATPNYTTGFTTLYSFTWTGSDGANPIAGLIADANGDLFGTTSLGGSSGGYGTVFELANQGTAAAPDYSLGATTLYSFTSTGSDGDTPAAGLIADANGNLFGTAYGGGSADYGTVFELVNSGTAAAPEYTTGATTLYSFTWTDGANPFAGLIVDANGDLFGTTSVGGSGNFGTVFEIVNYGTVAAPNYDMGAQTVYNFTGGPGDGATPYAVLHADAVGNLFGTTYSGGPDGSGTVFEIKDSGYIICFMRGTLVRTPDGEAAIETLKRGDLVLTADGKAMPVAWLGRQTVSTRFADPLRVLPIRVKAGALAENKPSRDLLVSPSHALLVGEILVEAGALVNGVSILRETDVPAIFVYFHIELDDHSLIFAQNTPAETFIDNVDRMAFDNWAEHEALYPGGNPMSELPFPRAKSRRQVPAQIRGALEARAAKIGGASTAAAA